MRLQQGEGRGSSADGSGQRKGEPWRNSGAPLAGDQGAGAHSRARGHTHGKPMSTRAHWRDAYLSLNDLDSLSEWPFGHLYWLHDPSAAPATGAAAVNGGAEEVAAPGCSVLSAGLCRPACGRKQRVCTGVCQRKKQCMEAWMFEPAAVRCSKQAPYNI